MLGKACLEVMHKEAGSNVSRFQLVPFGRGLLTFSVERYFADNI